MNVLIVSFLVPASPSGVVTYYKALASDLAGAGVNSHTVDSSHMPVAWRKFLGVLKRIMRPLGGAFAAAREEFAYFSGIYLSVRRLRNSHFDLIHAQDPRSGVAAWLALGRRVPVVVSCHFNDTPVQELVGRFLLKPNAIRKFNDWYTYLFSHIHNYVFSSDYAYAKSKHLLPSVVNKLTLLNTVRLPPPVNHGQLDRSTSERLIISNVGYVDERKNQKLLLEIGHELRNRGIDGFVIWLIGDGPKRVEYERLAYELDLTDHVTFYGHQTASWQLVAQSDLYVHTALNDNCPFSIVEAFAVGTPVLALPVGGIPEMLPEGFGALTGANVGELTTEVIRYFDPQHREKLAEAQTSNAALAFSSQANLEKLLLFYRQVIGESALATVQPDYVS